MTSSIQNNKKPNYLDIHNKILEKRQPVDTRGYTIFKKFCSKDFIDIILSYLPEHVIPRFLDNSISKKSDKSTRELTDLYWKNLFDNENSQPITWSDCNSNDYKLNYFLTKCFKELINVNLKDDFFFNFNADSSNTVKIRYQKLIEKHPKFNAYISDLIANKPLTGMNPTHSGDILFELYSKALQFYQNPKDDQLKQQLLTALNDAMNKKITYAARIILFAEDKTTADYLETTENSLSFKYAVLAAEEKDFVSLDEAIQKMLRDNQGKLLVTATESPLLWEKKYPFILRWNALNAAKFPDYGSFRPKIYYLKQAFLLIEEAIQGYGKQRVPNYVYAHAYSIIWKFLTEELVERQNEALTERAVALLEKAIPCCKEILGDLDLGYLGYVALLFLRYAKNEIQNIDNHRKFVKKSIKLSIMVISKGLNVPKLFETLGSAYLTLARMERKIQAQYDLSLLSKNKTYGEAMRGCKPDVEPLEHLKQGIRYLQKAVDLS